MVVEMSEVKDTDTEEQNKPRPWHPWRPPKRQTRWWVLWAAGMVIALVALGLLVTKLNPIIWETLSRGWVATLIGIGVALTVIMVLLAIGGAALGWTGFSEKKLWDWLQLLSALAIPIVLAAAGFWFTMQQDQRQHRIEAQRAQQEQDIEDQRAESERELEEQRAQDAALQAYLDQMSALMLDRNLLEAEEGDPVYILAQSRTSTVITRLDAKHNESVMRFLLDSKLAGTEESSINILKGITVEEAALKGADLDNISLKDADLSGADLRGADLSGAILEGADLSNANLSNVSLSKA